MKKLRLATLTLLLTVMLVTTFAIAVTPAAAFVSCGQLCPMENKCTSCAIFKQQTWVCAKAQCALIGSTVQDGVTVLEAGMLGGLVQLVQNKPHSHDHLR